MGYRHLGIEKEMNEAVEEFNKTDLQLIEESEYFLYPGINKRDGGEYVEVEVIDCSDDRWWYKKLIGFTFFCRIDYGSFYAKGATRRFIKGFTGVKLTNNKEIVFRNFDPADVSII